MAGLEISAGSKELFVTASTSGELSPQPLSPQLFPSPIFTATTIISLPIFSLYCFTLPLLPHHPFSTPTTLPATATASTHPLSLSLGIIELQDGGVWGYKVVKEWCGIVMGWNGQGWEVRVRAKEGMYWNCMGWDGLVMAIDDGGGMIVAMMS
ncbi:hypothetical protein TEA_013348 [Camellia sinensis var. sinensis]|uniref:Uncharacterized protein n=1 Tax=Camellia sinensis var. sinensis TaxID=542762 RepID=A0A4V3WIZ5_CAMSN|nr:hypothetical protein TEA_013348 [Camellia sinensis var. sinensis]